MKWITFLTLSLLTKRWIHAPTAHTKLQGFPLVMLSNFSQFFVWQKYKACLHQTLIKIFVKHARLPPRDFVKLLLILGKDTRLTVIKFKFQFDKHLRQKINIWVFKWNESHFWHCHSGMQFFSLDQLIFSFYLREKCHRKLKNTVQKSSVIGNLLFFLTIRKLHRSQNGDSMPQLSAHFIQKCKAYPLLLYQIFSPFSTKCKSLRLIQFHWNL